MKNVHFLIRLANSKYSTVLYCVPNTGLYCVLNTGLYKCVPNTVLYCVPNTVLYCVPNFAGYHPMQNVRFPDEKWPNSLMSRKTRQWNSC